MIGDIFSVQVNIGCPQSAASFTLWYRETATVDQHDFGTEAIAEAWHDETDVSLRAFMADDYNVVSFTARKHFQLQEPKFRFPNAVQAGSRPGPGLPANNAIVVSLAQGTFPAKSNGRIFLPGLAEADTDVGVIDAAMQIAVQTFMDQIATGLDEPSPGTGHWELGVISQIVLRVPNAPPDWPGSFAPVTALSSSPILQTQRRRTTKIVGQSA